METEGTEQEADTTTEVVEETEQAEAQEPVETPQTDSTPPEDSKWYPRFQEVNRKAQEAEARAREYERMAWEAQQRYQAPQQPQHIFDAETDNGIAKLIDQRTAPLQHENMQLRINSVMDKVEALPGFHENEREVVAKLQALGVQPGISDVSKTVETVKTILTAIKAERGDYSKEATQAARVQQQQRAAARVPTGTAGRTKEAAPKYEDMTYEQRAAYRSKLKEGL